MKKEIVLAAALILFASTAHAAEVRPLTCEERSAFLEWALELSDEIIEIDEAQLAQCRQRSRDCSDMVKKLSHRVRKLKRRYLKEKRENSD